MKSFHLLFFSLIVLLAACNKSEDEKIVDPKITINGETFTPSSGTIKKIDKSLVLTFTENAKKVEITTNDTIEGTYNVTSTKSAGELTANLTYTDGTNTYKANKGSVKISKSTSGTISGTYEATLGDAGTSPITISGGTFADIVPVKISTLIETEAAITDSLINAYSQFNRYLEFCFLFDAVYANTVSSPGATWNNIYAHSQDPTDSKVLLFWNSSYKLIFKCNLIIESAAKVITNADQLASVTSQAKVIRAYAYSYLLRWFNSVPIETGIVDNKTASKSANEVQSFIMDDLAAAADQLPNKWTAADKFRVSKYMAMALEARLRINNAQYAEAKTLTDNIVNSGQFALSYDTCNFAETNNEIFLGFNRSTSTEFSAFFVKSPFVPALRYTEILLTASEAAFRLGDMMTAMQYINMLKQRRGTPVISEVSADIILNQWQIEMKHEGSSFSVLRRFDRVVSKFQIPVYKQLLPVPQLILETHPLLMQNPGY